MTDDLPLAALHTATRDYQQSRSALKIARRDLTAAQKVIQSLGKESAELRRGYSRESVSLAAQNEALTDKLHALETTLAELRAEMVTLRAFVGIDA